MDSRRTLAAAGTLIALATVLGAFGAHALRAQLPPDRLQIFETAVRYQFFHALGLLAVGVLMRSVDSAVLRGSALAIVIGIILFSGSLYLLTFGAPRALGVITPLGGLALIAGWLGFVVAILRH
ncbi:MAG TPA: DUF423 domain-containing protein [Steroidobacteraceae bacterium]|nr:DUF423 domain-containing protein [Steroidobacteraceae bacterium]